MLKRAICRQPGLKVSLRSDAMGQCYASNEDTLDLLCSVHRPFEKPPVRLD